MKSGISFLVTAKLNWLIDGETNQTYRFRNKDRVIHSMAIIVDDIRDNKRIYYTNGIQRQCIWITVDATKIKRGDHLWVRYVKHYLGDYFHCYIIDFEIEPVSAVKTKKNQ